MSGISPVQGVAHGHAVHSIGINDLRSRLDHYRVMAEKYELLLSQVLTLEALPETLRNNIESTLNERTFGSNSE